MWGIPVAMVWCAAGEWAIHKYVLHDRGKDKRSWWSFHFHEHHRASRLSGMVDADYRRSPIGLHAQGKELIGLVGLAVAHAPLLPVMPLFTATVWWRHVHYYRVHKRAHLDPEWAREHLPWHYDHHMGPDQDKNWGVTSEWFDKLMGTREPYVGTEREARDQARRREREERRAAK